MKSMNNNCFKYSSYWGTWSRVLFHRSKGTEAMAQKLGIPDWVDSIEVDLTAVNPTELRGWQDKVKHENIRAHTTDLAYSDTLAMKLPEDIVVQMSSRLPSTVVEKVLHFDYLPLIDWDKYQVHCNGGAAFYLIQK